MKTRLLIDDQSKPCTPTVKALQKGEVVAYCLGEGLTCTAVAQRLGIPVSSLAKWVSPSPSSIAVCSVILARPSYPRNVLN